MKRRRRRRRRSFFFFSNHQKEILIINFIPLKLFPVFNYYWRIRIFENKINESEAKREIN
jgi:hypothetical protein